VASLESQGRDCAPQPTSSRNDIAEVESEVAPPAQYPSPYEQAANDDLSSKVAVLDMVTAQREPHYLGSSSAFAFSRIVNLSLRTDLPGQPDQVIVGDAEHTGPSPCMLPDYDTALSLSNAYFEFIHPQYPFLHEPTFRQWETTIYNGSPNLSEDMSFSLVLFFTNMVSLA